VRYFLKMKKKHSLQSCSYGSFASPSTVNQQLNNSDSLVNYCSSDDDSSRRVQQDDSEPASLGSTYIIEPVAFIQNLASCIMGFSLGQFIYSRILNRLIKEANANSKNVSTDFTKLFSFVRDSSNGSHIIPIDPSDTTNVCQNESSWVPLTPSKNVSSALIRLIGVVPDQRFLSQYPNTGMKKN
jgi:hypothetical protein